jgi:hypothetical protein
MMHQVYLSKCLKGDYKYLDLSAIDTKLLKDSIISEGYDGLTAISVSDFETKIQYVSQ